MTDKQEAAAARAAARSLDEPPRGRTSKPPDLGERSLGDVLSDPYVAGVIVNAGTAAVGWTVGHFTGGDDGGQAAPPEPAPPADDDA